MAKKLTKEQFIEKAKISNPTYDYSEIEYVNTTSEITVKCEHGHNFSMKARSFYKKVNCPECSRIKFEKQFIEKARKIHGDKYNYDNINYINNDTPVIITCPIHGEFSQRPSDHLKGYGCSKCSGKYKPTTEEWIKKVAPIYNYKYDYSKVNYIDNKTPVTVICSIHGEFYPFPNNHAKGISGCPKCAAIDRHNKYAKTTEQFIEDARKVHGNKYDYSKVEYYNKSTEVIIICPKHGEFPQMPSSHLDGCGCSKCRNKNQTLLFEKLKNSFPNVKILYEVGNKTVPWLTSLRFDIYFPDYNIAIEYDGQQHYAPIEHFGGELKFIKTKERDELKNKLCIENDCKLFRLKYDYNEKDYNNLVENISTIIKNNFK